MPARPDSGPVQRRGQNPRPANPQYAQDDRRQQTLFTNSVLYPTNAPNDRQHSRFSRNGGSYMTGPRRQPATRQRPCRAGQSAENPDRPLELVANRSRSGDYAPNQVAQSGLPTHRTAKLPAMHQEGCGPGFPPPAEPLLRQGPDQRLLGQATVWSGEDSSAESAYSGAALHSLPQRGPGCRQTRRGPTRPSPRRT